MRSNLTSNPGGLVARFLILALVGAFSTSAFAVTPCASAAPCKAAPVVAPLKDCGAANDELCTPATDVDGDGYFTDSLSMLDCIDTDKSVHPTHLSVIGDGLDNDCSGDSDDEEIAAALIEAKGETSPAGIALAKDMSSCYDSPLEGTATFVWSKEPGKPWTCNGLTDGLSFERGKGVLTETQTHELETSRRIAADKATLAKTKAALEGYAVVAATNAAETKAFAEGKVAELTAVVTSLTEEIAKLEAELKGEQAAQRAQLEIVDSKVDAVAKDVGTLKADVETTKVDVSDLQRRGMIFEVGAGAGFLAQRSLVDADGTVYRSGMVGSANVVASIGYGVPNASLTLDLSFGEGSTGSLGGTVPDTVASAAVVGQYRHGDMGIGPMLTLSSSATGNPLDSGVSGWGPGIGAAASWFAPNEKGLRIEVKTHLTIGIENFGTDTSLTTKYWDSGLMGEGGVTVLVGGGPRK